MERLDVLIVGLGLVPSRSKAQRLIRDGHVLVDGVAVTKPAANVATASSITVDKGDDYVSRGAYKLIGAFDEFSGRGLPSPRGLRCLDIGASTGGFCDVLLRRGAAQVIALDVGHGQLDSRIARDPRIIEMSGVNIRDVTAANLPYRPDMIVSDVSFISLTYVIPVIARIAAPGASVVLLVKPQFEVGKGNLGKGGIVEDRHLRDQALETVVDCANQHGLTAAGTAPSPIEGTHGNTEFLLFARLKNAASCADSSSVSRVAQIHTLGGAGYQQYAGRAVHGELRDARGAFHMRFVSQPYEDALHQGADEPADTQIAADDSFGVARLGEFRHAAAPEHGA